MNFRKDINGLRAFAVIAVVLFHFKPTWLPGGFAGVDVFFVISGFLMTSIIFRGFDNNKFSIISFYISRANRIIPALALLCLILCFFSFFYITPVDYKVLGKHVVGSIGFFSNILYLREAGYFDSASHEKWLLHTWSLSVEWQFYILYPLILVFLKSFFPKSYIKKIIFIFALLGFVFCIYATYKWPVSSYFLLPTRAWEMMFGGIAYLYPLTISHNKKRYVELLGFICILGSYFFISKDNYWPGFLAAIPVFGTVMVIMAQRNDSFFTSNVFFQKIGLWSYSIYLWHWPLVVAVYYYSLNEFYSYFFILLSFFIGFLSYTHIESVKLKSYDFNFKTLFMSVPVYLFLATSFLGFLIYINDGFIKKSPIEYQRLISKAQPSPYRNKCHIDKYHSPSKACEFFGENVTWAVFGDSHSVEIAYSLAVKLKSTNQSVKQFTYSGCIPSYKEPNDFSECSKWYNETVKYILESSNIHKVILNHRFTTAFSGRYASGYPELKDEKSSGELNRRLRLLDKLITDIAKVKDDVYIFYPIPEPGRD
jgi:peptidoglycan/LPS O-acetylase OafA/YrhL